MGRPELGYFEDPELEREIDRAAKVYQRTELGEEVHLRGYGMGPTGHFGKGPKGYKISDEWVWENVCDALFRSPEIDASEINVEVKDAVVILRGEVEDWPTRRAVEDCVYDVEGVKDVFTELRVKK